MYYGLSKYISNKISSKAKVELAKKLLIDVLESADDSIKNAEASSIIETVVRSQGNKVVDFIIKD